MVLSAKMNLWLSSYRMQFPLAFGSFPKEPQHLILEALFLTVLGCVKGICYLCDLWFFISFLTPDILKNSSFIGGLSDLAVAVAVAVRVGKLQSTGPIQYTACLCSFFFFFFNVIQTCLLVYSLFMAAFAMPQQN